MCIELTIEITRQCNLNCCHCLRGEPEDKVIDLKYIESVFSQVSQIQTLTLTGGEPALYPHIIAQIADLIKDFQIDVQNFYIATNGTIASDEFLMACLKLWCACSDNEVSTVHISNDQYHDEDKIRENLHKFQALSFMHFRSTAQSSHHGFTWDNIDKGDVNSLLHQGRAEGWGEREIKSVTIDPEYPEDANWYLNCNGDILLGCDWSYENQESEVLGGHDQFLAIYERLLPEEIW